MQVIEYFKNYIKWWIVKEIHVRYANNRKHKQKQT